MARHFFTTDELQALARRNALMKRTLQTMAQRLDQEERIANAALHDLAVERGVDVGKFMRVYRREQLAGERRVFYLNEETDTS